MRANFAEIDRVLRTEGVISRRQHPHLDATLRFLAGKGDLVRVLPGVYASAAVPLTSRTRMAALMVYDPDAVLTGAAAASVSFWRNIPVPVVTCAVREKRKSQPGFVFSRRAVPAELVSGRPGLRFTSVAMTALDLCDAHGGDAIDRALRSRRTTLNHLNRAMELTSARVGNRARRRLLLDSRDEPWSAAERRLHQLLRAAGIKGWTANRSIKVDGANYFPDLRFRGPIRLLIEVDGREFHSDEEVFESDRWRQNVIVLDGWCVLRFTWRMVEERPEQVVAMIRRALAMLQAK